MMFGYGLIGERILARLRRTELESGAGVESGPAVERTLPDPAVPR
jgi:hypothetical protein